MKQNYRIGNNILKLTPKELQVYRKAYDKYMTKQTKKALSSTPRTELVEFFYGCLMAATIIGLLVIILINL